MDTHETVPAAVLTSIATHFNTLTCLHLINEGGDAPALDATGEAGLQELTRSCAGLERVILAIHLSNATLVEFCRLCPIMREL